MAEDSQDRRFSLRRWSQRKLEAARQSERRHENEATHAPAHADTTPVAMPASAAAPNGANATAPTPQASPPPLPPVESLTIDSDFSPFLRPGVDEGVKQSALRKLFHDPRFNVMDGLDVYIDDYSKPDPIDAALVRTLVQARHIFDPPKTRVNAQGYVEDVPEEPRAVANDQPDALPHDGSAPPTAAAIAPREQTTMPATNDEPLAGEQATDPKMS